MRKIVLASLLAAVAATPAMAQDRGSFEGPRVEGIVGWDRAESDAGSKEDLGYGVAVGYDKQMGKAVLGLEAEYSDSDQKLCAGLGNAADPETCLKAGRDLYVGARVGTEVAPGTLLYAKAGYTNADAKITSDNGVDEVTVDKTHLDGVRVGAGVEHKVSGNAYVKGEYRYSNYEMGFERHQLMAGVGIRF